MLSIIIIFLSLLVVNNMEAVDKRESRISLTTSVIIPCHIKHFPMLFELLTAYAEQVVVPDEVVVVISETHALSARARKHLEYITRKKWPYSLKALAYRDPVFAGYSRNIACENSKGDIFICQDADDLPHPQRVQVIKWFFEMYDVEHLMHKFVESCDKNIFEPLELDKIKYKSPARYKQIHYIANGPVAIRRNVFERVKWIHDFVTPEDVLFNQNCYAQPSLKAVVLYDVLYLYRLGLQRSPI